MLFPLSRALFPCGTAKQGVTRRVDHPRPPKATRNPAAKLAQLGASLISATHPVSEVCEQVTNAFKVIALDFQQIILERAAGAASGLELAE